METINYTQSQWYSKNANAKEYYLSEYPFLKDFAFPVPMTTLVSFYKEDTAKRNIVPNDQFLDTYDFALSYFLENYPKRNSSDRFIAKSDLELLGVGLSEGIKKTFSIDIPQFFSGISQNLIIILILVLAILIFWKK